MNIAQLLLHSLSEEKSLREPATHHLETAARENLGGYLMTLARELHQEDRDVNVRRAAGIAIKNALHAKDTLRNAQLAKEWINLDRSLKQQVKEMTLRTLASPEQRVGSTAAQVISAMAMIELPTNQWPEVIQILLNNMTATQTTDALKKSTLEALGFICEELAPEILSYRSNEILTAIVTGARKEEGNNDIRLAAITALYNSLEFIRENFEREAERNYLMQVVCEATQSIDARVRVAAFECLVEIMHLYYDKMGLYMSQALCGLTLQAMKSEDEGVSLQAIEFWSTVCDEEDDLNNEYAEFQETGQQPDRVHHHFAKTYLPHVVPVLTYLLSKQAEFEDEDTWNIAMAAGTCLSLMANCVGDDIVDHVLPFVRLHIQDPTWTFREAAVMAFGSILEGPSLERLEPLVRAAFPILLVLTRDPVVQVKDTAAWTLGRICCLAAGCLDFENNPRILQDLINVLLAGLMDDPRVAANCSWAIMNLSDHFGHQEDGGVSEFANFFDAIVAALLQTTARPDGDESNLRTSAYESLSSVVQNAPRSVFPSLANLVTILLDRLKKTVEIENHIIGIDAKLEHAELQSSLCAVLQNITRRLGPDMRPFADDLMQLFLKMFSTPTGKHSTTLEDALLAIGSLTTALEADFARYMDAFMPFLGAALKNHAEHQVCSIAIGLVGDICRALGESVFPYCTTFMNLLFENLQSAQLIRSVKPPILSCFGDIALAIGGQFQIFLTFTMDMLGQACAIRADSDDYEMIDYVIVLREGILEAYTGIVQGLKSGNLQHLILPHVRHIISFIETVFREEERSDAVTRDASGLLGDLADALGPQIGKDLCLPWIDDLLRECKASSDKRTKEVAKWSKTVIKTVTG